MCVCVRVCVCVCAWATHGATHWARNTGGPHSRCPQRGGHTRGASSGEAAGGGWCVGGGGGADGGGGRGECGDDGGCAGAAEGCGAKGCAAVGCADEGCDAEGDDTAAGHAAGCAPDCSALAGAAHPRDYRTRPAGCCASPSTSSCRIKRRTG